MSVTEINPQMGQVNYLRCDLCNAVLPVSATFCGSCGERVAKAEIPSSHLPRSVQNDVPSRYRITSLIRRRPCIQLSFALDIQQQRLIMLRDIDISGLDEMARHLAHTELQQEYDLLQHQHMSDVMPLIASHCSEGHLYSIAGWPFPLHTQEGAISGLPSSRPYTLHDLLQSGIGLPAQPVTISWIRKLTQAVEDLHKHQIVIGELDPETIIVSSHDYSGQPALMVSWIPTGLRHLLFQVSHTAKPSSFRASETVDRQENEAGDIYSLGALLYLLLTGTAPKPLGAPATHQQDVLRSPRDLNPRISSRLDAIVMQALALEPNQRFQRASELAAALLHVEKRSPLVRRPAIPFARPPKSTPKLLAETPVSSERDNNESASGKVAQSIEGSSDETMQIRDVHGQQAQHLSRIHSGALSSQEQQTGEATVDKVHIQAEQFEDPVTFTYLTNQAFEAISPYNDEGLTENKSQIIQALSAIDEHTPEVINIAESQEQLIQVAPPSQAFDVLTESVNQGPLLENTDDVSTDGGITAFSNEITLQMRTPPLLAISKQFVEETSPPKTSLDAQQSLAPPTTVDVITPRERAQPQEDVLQSAMSQDGTPQPKTSSQDVTQPEAMLQPETSQEERSQAETAQQDVTTVPAERQRPAESQEKHPAPTSVALVPQFSMLPALQPSRSKGRALALIKDLLVSTRSRLIHQTQPAKQDSAKDIPLLERVQRFILGEQRHATTAVALIETPMRIQPTQSYAIRIQIIGRDRLKDTPQTGGLSAFMQGDIVHMEVRLALYQSYAYMVQQADVEIPASGYAAEVTVPMHPLSSGPSSRRERLQIFFMDRARNPLYEKPFVIELFVSPSVQLGHEGHNVLSLPI